MWVYQETSDAMLYIHKSILVSKISQLNSNVTIHNWKDKTLKYVQCA